MIGVVSHAGCGPDKGYAISLDELAESPESWLKHLAEKLWWRPHYKEIIFDALVLHRPQAYEAFNKRMGRFKARKYEDEKNRYVTSDGSIAKWDGWVRCETCGCNYHKRMRKPGDVCGDRALNPDVPCVGLCVSKPAKVRKEIVMRTTTVQFFKDGDSMAIVTDGNDEREFMAQAAAGLAQESDRPEYERELAVWLPQIVDIVCKMRGYKANVTERRLLMAGEWLPSASAQPMIQVGPGMASRKPTNGAADVPDAAN